MKKPLKLLSANTKLAQKTSTLGKEELPAETKAMTGHCLSKYSFA